MDDLYRNRCEGKSVRRTKGPGPLDGVRRVEGVGQGTRVLGEGWTYKGGMEEVRGGTRSFLSKCIPTREVGGGGRRDVLSESPRLPGVDGKEGRRVGL